MLQDERPASEILLLERPAERLHYSELLNVRIATFCSGKKVAAVDLAIEPGLQAW